MIIKKLSGSLGVRQLLVIFKQDSFPEGERKITF